MAGRDVTEADFEPEVIERSYERPVVVDFWAGWCAPCRQLTPVLERVAEQHAGEVDLVKVDVDANPGVAAAFQVQGIPAVKAFRNGAVISEFVGAYPEPAVRRFFESILPSEADRLAAAGDEAADAVEAERAYRSALELDRGHRAAVLGLAPILATRGEFDAARSLLSRLPEDQDVRRVRAQVDLTEATGDGGPDPASLAERDWEPELERLLDEVRKGDREAAREKMVDIFEVLGPEHPLTTRFRSELASALF